MESKKIEFGKGDDELLCPHCGGHCLHHFRVEVFNRTSEDAEYGTMSVIESELPETIKGLKFEASFQNNPSPRRDGLRIFFWCEFCPKISVLDIIQHKGSTYIEWK